jgi:isoleucyl-tRNA synthetase
VATDGNHRTRDARVVAHVAGGATGGDRDRVHAGAGEDAARVLESSGTVRATLLLEHVLATGLFDRWASSACLAHDTVLGKYGQKTSRARKDYSDVREVLDRDGSDTMGLVARLAFDSV